MLNPTVYGKSPSAPHGTAVGVSGINWQSLIEQGKEKVSEALGSDVKIPDLPSQEVATEVGEQLAEAHGKAVGAGAASQFWSDIKPFVISGLVVGGIFLLSRLGRRK